MSENHGGDAVAPVAAPKAAKSKEVRSVKERVLLRSPLSKNVSYAVAGLKKLGVWEAEGEITFDESAQMFKQDVVRTKEYPLEKRIEKRRVGTSGASVFKDFEVIQPIEEKHEQFRHVTNCCDVVR